MNKFSLSQFSLKGKKAIVTGAGGHLCSPIVEALVNLGCKVAMIDIRLNKIKKLKNKLEKKGFSNNLIFEVDVTNLQDFKKTFKLIKNKFKKIDILINGAGINSPTPFFEITETEWKNVVNSHLLSTLFCIQTVGKDMIKNKKGSIINFSSASSGPPLSKAFAYSVAKSGIKNLTQNTAREFAKNNVRINAIRPGFFPTEWNKKNFIDKARKLKILNHTPMGRFGLPNELVGGIIWLCSDTSSFVTGIELTIDGGFSAMTI